MSEGKRYKWTREKMVPVEWGPYMNYLDHLAALRRAKAAGVREAAILCRDVAALLMSSDIAIVVRSTAETLDARAAQIEQGE